MSSAENPLNALVCSNIVVPSWDADRRRWADLVPQTDATPGAISSGRAPGPAGPIRCVRLRSRRPDHHDGWPAWSGPVCSDPGTNVAHRCHDDLGGDAVLGTGGITRRCRDDFVAGPTSECQRAMLGQ